MENMKPEIEVKMLNGQIVIEGKMNELASLQLLISPIKILEAVAHATPTEIDDKLLPFAEMIVKAIGSKA